MLRPILSPPPQKLMSHLVPCMISFKLPFLHSTHRYGHYIGGLQCSCRSNFNTWKSVIGPHRIGESNSSGVRLLDFCSSNHLLITNTWFQHKTSHRATWYRNGDCSRPGHMIDFVLVNSHFHSSVLDTHAYCSVHHESDHKVVMSSLHLKNKANAVSQELPFGRLLTYLQSLSQS